MHWETNEHTTLSLKEASRRVISAAPTRPGHEAGGATHAATTLEIVEYALPKVDEDVQSEARPAIVEPPKDDMDTASIVTPDDAANSSILKMSGAPASKRRRVFDDRLNVVPLGPLPRERPLGPSAHEIWFGRPED